jgi:hypothetical protein
MESDRGPESAPTQACELAHACEMARKLQALSGEETIMSNQALMFVGGAVALVVVATLVIAFFVMRRGAVVIARVPLVGRVLDRRKPQPEQDALFALAVLRIRVPGVDPDGAFGRKDAMSILLTTSYFNMIKKMGASSTAPTR